MPRHQMRDSLSLPLLTALCFLSTLVHVLPAQARELDNFLQKKEGAPATEETANTGQDFTKPLTRLDIREKYQDLPSGKDGYTTTFRMDKPVILNKEGWVLSLRADLPLTANDVISNDNPNSNYEFGMSDFLNQIIMIAPQGKKAWTYAFGAQLIYPTASQDQMGTGRLQIAPLVGAKLDLHGISKGSFSYMLVRNHIDAGGYSSRAHQNYLVLQPGINIALPKRFFITMAPEMKVNYMDDNNWFIPFDITLGKMLNKSTVVSLEYKTPIYDKNWPNYVNEVEARVGFFF